MNSTSNPNSKYQYFIKLINSFLTILQPTYTPKSSTFMCHDGVVYLSGRGRLRENYKSWIDWPRRFLFVVPSKTLLREFGPPNRKLDRTVARKQKPERKDLRRTSLRALLVAIDSSLGEKKKGTPANRQKRVPWRFCPPVHTLWKKRFAFAETWTQDLVTFGERRDVSEIWIIFAQARSTSR